jgi:hypothetical protein
MSNLGTTTSGDIVYTTEIIHHPGIPNPPELWKQYGRWHISPWDETVKVEDVAATERLRALRQIMENSQRVFAEIDRSAEASGARFAAFQAEAKATNDAAMA